MTSGSTVGGPGKGGDAGSRATHAQALLATLQAFAAAQTNAVLAVLDDPARIVAERKYPAGSLWFGGGLWRAYYHCHAPVGTRSDTHSTPAAQAGEHGHFHLFRRLPPARYGRRDADPFAEETGCPTQDTAPQWSHLAALAMDHQGLPLRWFAVNHWVSGGVWLSAPQWEAVLAMPGKAGEAPDTPQALTGAWLFAMLGLYRDTLVELLHARDAFLQALPPTQSSWLEGHHYYELASRPVQLLDTLHAALSDGHTDPAPPRPQPGRSEQPG